MKALSLPSGTVKVGQIVMWLSGVGPGLVVVVAKPRRSSAGQPRCSSVRGDWWRSAVVTARGTVIMMTRVLAVQPVRTKDVILSACY